MEMQILSNVALQIGSNSTEYLASLKPPLALPSNASLMLEVNIVIHKLWALITYRVEINLLFNIIIKRKEQGWHTVG